jgi:hypothetical protein
MYPNFLSPSGKFVGWRIQQDSLLFSRDTFVGEGWEMHSETAGDVQNESENDDMAWNNDWDDNDSTGALESQRILNPDMFDEDEEEIEDEIRANLSSKITSSLHAYKIAGVALIITLISFTINTVSFLLSHLD